MKTVQPVMDLKWGPLPPNEVCRIVLHVKKGEGRKEGKDEVKNK